MMRILVCHIFLLLPLLVWGQADLQADFKRLTYIYTEAEEKTALSAQITNDIVLALEHDKKALDSLEIPQLKKAESPEGELCFYTWHYSFSDAMAQYGGVIVFDGRVIPLVYSDEPILPHKKYSASDWTGGICYEIIPVEYNGMQVYTLVSWDGNNGVTFKKILDILWFDNKGEPNFGKPIFVQEKQKTNRVVLEYNARTSFLLEYDDEAGGIASNNLALSDPRFEGIASYYGADETYNVYRYEDERWVLYKDVDFYLKKKRGKVKYEGGAPRKQNWDSPESGL